MAYTTIDDPSSVFQCTLYSGTGSQQSITNGGNSDLQPDFLWIKERDGTSSHQLVDSVRGYYLRMESDNSSADLDAGQTGATNQNVTSFDSDGFGVKNGAAVNASGNNYVAWQWKKQAGVFDIQTWTGNGSNRTISHNLGVIPQMMIVKKRNPAGGNWQVNTAQLAANQLVELDENTTAAQDNSYFNNTRPTSSVIHIGTDGNQNTNTHTYLAYLFGNKQGVCKVGSYLGNGESSNGTFVYTGFRPAWIMRKNVDGSVTEHWIIQDNKRNTFNVVDKWLEASTAVADDTAYQTDFLSNGFKMRSNNDGTNRSNVKYIYLAFAEKPFVTSTGVPTTAR